MRSLILLLLVYIRLALAEVYMETDITCDSRPNPILNYVQSKTTGILYQVRTIDSTGEIMMCGNFETTKGLGAKLNKSGTLAWAYLFSIPCEVMMLDTKQEYVMMVLKYPGRGVEIHRYAVKDGSKSFIFEYGVDTIYTLQDGIFKNDYYWFVGYLNTGVCFVLKISSTRRYVYMCPANTKMWNMLIPDKDPVIVGNNNANIPFIIKIGENDFATSLSYKISNINSDYMALRSSGADDTNLLWSLSLTSDKSLYLTYFNLNTTSFTWTKKYNYQVVKPMIQYSVVFDEYILLVRDEVNNRICFFRLDYSDGSITFYKCNANGSLVKYNVYTTSLFADQGSSIYYGGQLNQENFFIHRTGVELGDSSCSLQSSTIYTESYYSTTNFEISFQNQTLAMTSFLTGRWINRTDRAVVTEKTLFSTNYCAPNYTTPLLRPRHYTQRFMETLPSTCTGFNTLTIPNDTVYSLTVLDGSNSNGDVTLTTEGTSDQIVNSFWMDIGSYKFFLTMNRSSDPNNKMIVLFDATSELTAFMVLVVSLTYLAFFVIAVQAVISQDYYCIKHMIYSAQFIHLISLVAVNLPPPMVYFVQRMSIFGFIEGIFSKSFFLNSFNLMKIDRFYRINYETSSFLSNQILSVILLIFITGGMVLRNINWRKKNSSENPENNVVDFNKIDDADIKIPQKTEQVNRDYKKLALIYGFNVFSFLYPYLILHCILDITNMNIKNGATGLSFGLSCFVLMVTFKLSLLIVLFVFKKYISIKHNYGPLETVEDYTFGDLRIKNMIVIHLLFWSKRIAIIVIIIASPYLENIINVISGFIIFLCFTLTDMNYSATTNKLEPFYVGICYFPPALVSFMNMLMEGHYVPYSSKYVTCCFTISICMLVYLAVIPFRMYDYYKYQKYQQLKRIEHYRREKYGTTTNQSIFAYTNDKDASVSKYTNEDYMKSKFDDDMSQSKISNNTNSMAPIPKIESEDFEEINNENEDDKDYMKWKKKKITIVPNSDAKINFNVSGYSIQSQQKTPTAETELKNMEEEKRLPGSINFIGSSNIPDFSQPKSKKFNLPNF